MNISSLFRFCVKFLNAAVATINYWRSFLQVGRFLSLVGSKFGFILAWIFACKLKECFDFPSVFWTRDFHNKIRISQIEFVGSRTRPTNKSPCHFIHLLANFAQNSWKKPEIKVQKCSILVAGWIITFHVAPFNPQPGIDQRRGTLSVASPLPPPQVRCN